MEVAFKCCIFSGLEMLMCNMGLVTTPCYVITTSINKDYEQ